MIAQPVGYIRESAEDGGQTPEEQRAGQTAAVLALAKADGYKGRPRIFDDWNRSGAGDKIEQRKAYAEMLDAIRAGSVSVIYARSVDRLYRSVKTYSALLDLCRAHGVRIVTQRDGIVGGDGSPMATAFATVGATFAQLESDTAKVRRRYGVATQRRNIAAHAETGCQGCAETRLHGIGRRPYDAELTAAVLAAYDEAGSFLGATKLLTARKVPSLLGGRANPGKNGGTYGWDVKTVSRIVRRERPGLPKVGRKGAPSRSTHALSGLLVCHCGRTLSSMPRPGKRSTAWYCRAAHNDAGHSRPYVVSEAYILPAVRAELDLIDLAGDRVQAAARDAAAEREELTSARSRLALAYARGGLPTEAYTAEDEAITARLLSLADSSPVEDLGPLDDLWTWDPADANAVLRRVFRSITLGPDLRPLPDGFDWRNRSWRRVVPQSSPIARA
jgi:DNA invertase Pin-like site-specific DNA recombinase